MNNARNLYEYIKEILLERYDASESEAMSRWILESLYNVQWKDILTNKKLLLNPGYLDAINRILERLQNYEPLQYIIGEVQFLDFTLKVNRHVLIPRPETEEIARYILEKHQHQNAMRVVDIGTGSGCLAISMAAHLPESLVIGTDVSADALDLAHQNAERNQVVVNWLQMNILHSSLPEHTYDLMVSNPPYVCHKEKSSMKPNVLQYEPPEALFVPDEDPLLFYRNIVSQGDRFLNKGGHLYFEVNHLYATEVALLMKQQKFQEVTIENDLSGKPRLVWGRK